MAGWDGPGVSESTPPDHPPQPVGVLIVRLWHEPGAEAPLRARVTRSLDVRAPLSEVSTASDVEEICRTVRQWWDDFGARHARQLRDDA